MTLYFLYDLAPILRNLFNMSLIAGYIVPAVLLLRLCLKKAPKALTCLLWGVVGLRLLLPFSLESVMSLIPGKEPLPADFLTSETPQINTGISVLNQTVTPIIQESLPPAVSDTETPMEEVFAILALIWLIGLGVMLVYALISYIRVRRQVREAIRQEGNVYLCDRVQSPFILGLVRPKIYLPVSLSREESRFVLAHERAHIRRLDHIWKPLGFLILAVYWFNPLLWVAYILLCRDIELACDERVLRQLGAEAKKPYSEALISCAVSRRTVAACPLAFGEVGVKTRIKGILSYKKPTFWIILVALAASVIVAVCFLTDPKEEPEESTEPPAGGELVSVGEEPYHWLNETDREGKTILLEAFPNTLFVYDGGLCVEQNGIPTRIHGGMPIHNIYFYDATGDGKPDLCSDVSMGSGVVDRRVYVFDRAAERLYMICERGSVDYKLAMEDGVLGVLQKPFGGSPAAEEYGEFAPLTKALLEERATVTELEPVDSPTRAEMPADNSPLLWFDRAEENLYLYDARAIRVDAYPGVTFWHRNGSQVSAVTDEGERILYSATLVQSVYFYDVTGDGNPELCSTVGLGTEYGSAAVHIYDYVNSRILQISEPGKTDYRLQVKNGRPGVESSGFREESYGGFEELNAAYAEKHDLKWLSVFYGSVTPGEAPIPEGTLDKILSSDLYADQRARREELREELPECFGLDTSEGLNVYVWQLARHHYTCALTAGGGEVNLAAGMELWKIGTSIEDMKLILSTYKITADKVNVIPYQHPLSSYAVVFRTEADRQTYVTNLRYMLGVAGHRQDMTALSSPITYTAPFQYDVDEDGTVEVLTLSMGPTSGLFTVTLQIAEQGELTQQNIYLCPWHQDFIFFEQKGRLYIGGGKDTVKYDEEGNATVTYESQIYAVTYEQGEIVIRHTETGEAWGRWGQK